MSTYLPAAEVTRGQTYCGVPENPCALDTKAQFGWDDGGATGALPIRSRACVRVGTSSDNPADAVPTL